MSCESRLPSGSFDSAARCTTASKPSRSARVKIAEVFANLGNCRERVAEIAARKQIGVEADDFMACRTQDRPRDRADVALVTSQQNFHMAPCLESLVVVVRDRCSVQGITMHLFTEVVALRAAQVPRNR